MLWELLPFDEGLRVEAGHLDTHDGACDELFHGVGGLRYDGVDKVVF